MQDLDGDDMMDIGLEGVKMDRCGGSTLRMKYVKKSRFHELYGQYDQFGHHPDKISKWMIDTLNHDMDNSLQSDLAAALM